MMRKRRKGFAALVMIVAMLLTLIPTSVFAAQYDFPPSGNGYEFVFTGSSFTTDSSEDLKNALTSANYKYRKDDVIIIKFENTNVNNIHTEIYYNDVEKDDFESSGSGDDYSYTIPEFSSSNNQYKISNATVEVDDSGYIEIDIYFVNDPYYVIEKEATTNGSFTVTKGGTAVTEAEKGTEITVNPYPAEGYEIDKVLWKRDGGEYTDITNSCKFTMPDEKVYVKATFKKIASYYTVTVNAGDNGSVDKTTVSDVEEDTEISATNNVLTIGDESVIATADNGYEFDSWTGIPASGKITEDVTIKATFKKASPSTIPVTGVSLNKTAVTLDVGDEITLVATVTPKNATNKEVTWVSDKTSVAEVDSETGEVTAVAAGKATITVITDDGGKKASCVVTVKGSNPSPNPYPVIDWDQILKDSSKSGAAEEETEYVDGDLDKSVLPPKSILVTKIGLPESLDDFKAHYLDATTTVNQALLANTNGILLAKQVGNDNPNVKIIWSYGIYPRRDLSLTENGSKQTLKIKLKEARAVGSVVYAQCYSQKDGAYLLLGTVGADGYATFGNYVLREATSVTLFVIE